jgi:YfiH family protein
MPFHSSQGLRFLSFDNLAEAGVINAVFTRRGGLSPEPWASLNVGGLIGDDPQRVYENRVISFKAVGRGPESVYDVWQVHGAEVICTNAPRPTNASHREADAILTDRPEVTLFMRFADCVPILLCDPVKQVIGIAHAGWRGTVDGVALRTVETMLDVYGCKSTNILAAIGPSIGVHHYEVGPEVAEQVQQSFGEESANLLLAKNGAVHFDLWSANRLQLERMGVKHIEMSDICTACHPEDWFSHRGEQGKTGRFGALIALKTP